MKNNIERQEGQSLLVIALVMVAIIAFIGLLLDGGRVYAARRQSQNAADAAAFAGTQELLHSSCDALAKDNCILQVITKFAQKNGAASASDVIGFYMRAGDTVDTPGQQIGAYNSVQGNATGVMVKVTLHTQPFFITVLGSNQMVDTMSLAVMRSGPLTNFNGAEPMIVNINSIVYNGLTTLQGGKLAGGAFQWLQYDENCNDPNANSLADDILNPPTNITKAADPNHNYMNSAADHAKGLPHYFCSTTGEKVSDKVAEALDWWLGQPPEKRKWIIPIYDTNCTLDDNPCTGGGNGSKMIYHIIRFAEFTPYGYYFGGQGGNAKSNNMTKTECGEENHCVEGVFKGFTQLGHGDSGSSCNSNDGCAIWLDQ